MDFRLLGSLEVSADGALAELGPPKQRALLAILLLHAGEIVGIDRLIDLLWGENPPRTATHSIQIYVSDLRKAIEGLGGKRILATRPPGYQLDADRTSLDVIQFERLVEEGTRKLRTGNLDGADKLRAALRLWRGPALTDFTYEEFAQPYIRRFHDMHLYAIEELAAAELEAGRASDALLLLDDVIREDPLRERSCELLMLALYRSGRHAEALRTYQQLRSQLVEELGLDPSPLLQRLQERILLHDPSLLPPREAPTGSAARNPYKGLRPFSEPDADDFFGREGLVDRLVRTLAGGAHLVALVGPSGSGKSSVIAAGLIPALRVGAVPGSENWVIAQMTPGANPLGEVQAAVSAAADTPQGVSALLGSGAEDGGAAFSLRVMPQGGRLLLVIDQFEELFTITDEQPRRQFLSAIATAVAEPGTQLTVVLALRADYYDRPMLHPEFAQAFIPGVVNVLPMTVTELEAVVVRPAEGAGAVVEQSLLAELVADAADRPGTLPLLEYALTELFDQRSKGSLTLEGYRALGGMSGVLSRSAEALFGALSADEKQVTMQVFLRLVQLGQGMAESRRRLPVSELTDLDLDPVLLSKVLESFGDRRLLSFDRDTATGQATVELAHESLFREWERLAAWIDRHRAALKRYETLTAAAEDWEASGKHPDYLLTGTRLAEFEAWSREGTLQIGGKQRAFLDAGRARQADERARAETARRFVWPSFVDDRQNSAYAFFAENEGAYLAGVAAALKSRTGRIGFVGGHDDGFIWTWHAGYEAGARSIRPDIEIMSAYLSSGEMPTRFHESTGFHDAPAAEREARAMFEAGADVIFHAAGDSGVGVFEAAFALSGAERHLWAIGVDTDQYVTVRYIAGAVHPEEWRQHILTSVLKRVDLAMYQLGAEFARGQFRSGRHTFDLANGGVDISYSGGFIEDIRPQIDRAKQQIIAGHVRLPCIPVVRLELAAERGYLEDWCHNSSEDPSMERT